MGATEPESAGAAPSADRRGPFVSSETVILADADRALAALFEAIAGVGLGAGARIAIRLRELAGSAVDALSGRRDLSGHALIGRTVAIDLAAEVLECADELARSGYALEAFALEGIEGRLIESLVGAGLVAPLNESPDSV